MTLSILYARCAGLDVHEQSVVACLRYHFASIALPLGFFGVLSSCLPPPPWIFVGRPMRTRIH